MSNKLSIVIMAHPKRKEYIPYLLKMLGKNTPVVWDQKNNVWDTCRRAWLAHDPRAEYGVVIQDDALVTRDFRKKAEALLKEDFVYSFYAGYMLENRIRLAQERGKDHIISGMVFGEVALCMKLSNVPEMLKYSDDREATTDQLIGQWARQRRKPVCYPIPSLIDHRDGHSLYRELAGKPQGDKVRKAAKFHA